MSDPSKAGHPPKSPPAKRRSTADETRDRLIAATLSVLRGHGMAGLSARVIAAEADVNQALIFYHFTSVTGLVEAACRQDSQVAVASYADRFAAVETLGELLDVGRDLHVREAELGRVQVMAQVLAGGQSDPALAAVARDALELWRVEIAAVIRRVLVGSPVADVVDVDGLAGALSASFVGLELFQGVAPARGEAAFDALAQLGAVFGLLDTLGPLERRALQRRLRRARP